MKNNPHIIPDFGARMLDSATTTWTTPDPLAEKYYNISPYAYCANTPLRYTDSDGRDIYRYDDKTGEMVLYKKTDDNFDLIGKLKKGERTRKNHFGTYLDVSTPTARDLDDVTGRVEITN